MSLFGKKKKAIVNYIDLDNDKNNIATSGELLGNVGEEIGYSSSDQIDALKKQGYVLVNNSFDPSDKPTFSNEDVQTYTISFKHDVEAVDKPNSDFGISESDLQKVGTQTVHYEGAATRTPKDNVSQVVFKRSVVYDKILKKIISTSTWMPEKQSFLLIATPEVSGYTTVQTTVGGETVTPEDCDRNYVVEYDINHQPSVADQKVAVKYVDQDLENKEITEDILTGMPNSLVDYDPKATIERLESDEGYALVNNGYNPAGEVQFYSNNDDYVPVFVMTMKHTIGQVDSEHPDSKVNKNEYDKDVAFTINYEGADAATPVNNVQRSHWSRSLTVDRVTGEILPGGKYTTDWKVDREKYDDVDVPVVDGYHTDVKMIKGAKITRENIIRTVNYVANGHIIPVDSDGKEIVGAPHPVFQTDPNDPTQVITDEPVPKIDGYKCNLATITPYNPAKDMEVKYKAEDSDVLVISVGDKKPKSETKAVSVEKPVVKPDPKPENTNSVTQPAVTQDQNHDHDQVAIINFIDLDHDGKQLTSSGPLTGKPGESINDLYSTELPLKAIERAGYHVVFNGFDDNGTIQRFDNNDLMTQVFTIGLRKISDEQQTSIGLDALKKLDLHNNEDVAAIAFGVASTIISLIGLIGNKNDK